MKKEFPTPFGIINAFIHPDCTAFIGAVTVNRVEYDLRMDIKFIDGKWTKKYVHLDRKDQKPTPYNLNAHQKVEETILQLWDKFYTQDLKIEAHKEDRQNKIETLEKEISEIQLALREKEKQLETLIYGNRWKCIEQNLHYTFWFNGEVYNVTDDGNPPTTNTGYHNLNALKKFKGIS